MNPSLSRGLELLDGITLKDISFQSRWSFRDYQRPSTIYAYQSLYSHCHFNFLLSHIGLKTPTSTINVMVKDILIVLIINALSFFDIPQLPPALEMIADNLRE